jgi:acyl-CoA thioester hydrolase
MSIRQEAAEMLEQALTLPRYSTMIIPPDYLDFNGHVNVMYYSMIGNIGTHNFWEELGLSNQLKRSGGTRSTFMLRQVLNYVNELQQEEEIAIHAGLYDFDPRKLHYFVYTISLTNQRLACVDERLEICIDMTTRRSTAFDPEVLAVCEEIKARHAALGWKPKPSGAIRLG